MNKVMRRLSFLFKKEQHFCYTDQNSTTKQVLFDIISGNIAKFFALYRSKIIDLGFLIAYDYIINRTFHGGLKV